MLSLKNVSLNLVGLPKKPSFCHCEEALPPKQSRFISLLQKTGLLRYARNDGLAGRPLAGKAVLADISLEINSGITMLAGKNGAGKTSLFKIIAGVHQLCVGECRYKNNDWHKISSRQRAEIIAYLPQDATYAWPVKVSELVTEKMAESLGLSEIMTSRLDEVSGGEMQRVMLANLLGDDKPVLLLDEPLSSQDPAWRFKIMDLLKNISQTRTIIIAMHDIGLMSLYADRVIWLDGGRIVAEGINAATVEKIFGVEAIMYLSHLKS